MSESAGIRHFTGGGYCRIACSRAHHGSGCFLVPPSCSNLGSGRHPKTKNASTSHSMRWSSSTNRAPKTHRDMQASFGTSSLGSYVAGRNPCMEPRSYSARSGDLFNGRQQPFRAEPRASHLPFVFVLPEGQFIMGRATVHHEIG
jgi:hypothetical protein